MALSLSSPVFDPNGPIPKLYTCDGADASPPLAWGDVPEGAKSLVLIVDDPDAPDPAAPKINYVHWVLYDLPPSATGLGQARPGATPSPFRRERGKARTTGIARDTAGHARRSGATDTSSSSMRSTWCCRT